MSNAVPDATDPVAKIGDLAAAAGVRRIHVLAWRDLDDVEAGGSEVHIAEVAKLWAAAGLDVTMRTSWAQGQPTEAVRDGYKVIRRAGRHMVFPRAALAEMTGPHRAPRRPRRDLERHAVPQPDLEPGPPGHPAPPRARRDVEHDARRHARPARGSCSRARSLPRSTAARPIATLSESSKHELVDELGFRRDRVTVVHPGIDPRFSPGGERRPDPMVVGRRRLAPVKRYDVARAGRPPRPRAACPTSGSSSSATATSSPGSRPSSTSSTPRAG